MFDKLERRFVPDLSTGHNPTGDRSDGPNDGPVVEAYEDANILTSRPRVVTAETRDMHYPILDLDMPVYLIPSFGRPGHSHLYIDKLLTEAQMTQLIDTLVSVGLLEPGHKYRWEQSGALYLRKPGVVKDPNRLVPA